MKKIFSLFIICLLVFACSSQKPTFTLKLNIRLKNHGNLSAKVNIVFKTKAGLLEFKNNKNTIKRACLIILREYRSDQIEEKNKSKFLRILKKVIKAKIESEIEKIQILEYSVIGPPSPKGKSNEK